MEVYTNFKNKLSNVPACELKISTVHSGPVYISIIRVDCKIEEFRYVYLKVWKTLEKIGAVPKSASESVWVDKKNFHPRTPYGPPDKKRRKL